MENILHIILVGGKATRFGILSKGVPKTIMPIGNTTLLHRQISQSLNAGNKKILVATSKFFREQIINSLEEYPDIKVIYKTNDAKGPLYTLRNILTNVSKSTTIILTLGDIYFRDNPFTKLDVSIDTRRIYLAGAKAFNQKDLAFGGVIFVDKKKVTAIVKKSICGNNKGFKWSGTAIFNADIKVDLEKFLKFDKREIEDFFEYCRMVHYKVRFIEIPDFINVNKPEDFHIATLYNLAEVYKTGWENLFITAATTIRKEYLKNK